MAKRVSYLVVDGKVVETAGREPDFSALDAAVKKAAVKKPREAAVKKPRVPPVDLTHPSGRPIGNYL